MALFKSLIVTILFSSLTTLAQECLDATHECMYWTSIGIKCENNVDFMSKFCRKTCGLCDYSDVSNDTDVGGGAGGTQDSSFNFGPSLGASVSGSYGTVAGVGGVSNNNGNSDGGKEEEERDCVNRKRDCKLWASVGECRRNPVYMTSNCYRSCSDCNPAGLLGSAACADTNDQCRYWAEWGECEENPDYMLKRCPRSCRACESSDDDCLDSKDQCKRWAADGECQNNPRFMLKNCRKSCKVCGSNSTVDSDCRDLKTDCPYWAEVGECEDNPQYMLRNCRKSCSVCSVPAEDNSCKDRKTDCSDWSSAGECVNNPDFMLANCPKSCSVCETSELANDGTPVNSTAVDPVLEDEGTGDRNTRLSYALGLGGY